MSDKLYPDEDPSFEPSVGTGDTASDASFWNFLDEALDLAGDPAAPEARSPAIPQELDVDSFFEWLDAEQRALSSPTRQPAPIEVVQSQDPASTAQPSPAVKPASGKGKKPEHFGKFWVPDPVDGIQVNFCKNPACSNFGIPAGNELTRPKKGRPHKAPPSPSEQMLELLASATPPYLFGRLPGEAPTPNAPKYRLNGGGKNLQNIVCGECKRHTALKSNKAVAEELLRIGGRLFDDETEPSCQTAECVNNGIPVSAGGGRYLSKGFTAAGTKRYSCKSCGHSFTGIPGFANKHRKVDAIEEVFEHVVSKVVIKKSIRLAKINPQTFYDKLDYVYDRCVRFLAARAPPAVGRDSVAADERQRRPPELLPQLPFVRRQEIPRPSCHM